MFQDLLTVIQVFGNFSAVSELHWQWYLLQHWVYVLTVEVSTCDCNVTWQCRLQKSTTTTTTTLCSSHFYYDLQQKNSCAWLFIANLVLNLTTCHFKWVFSDCIGKRGLRLKCGSDLPGAGQLAGLALSKQPVCLVGQIWSWVQVSAIFAFSAMPQTPSKRLALLVLRAKMAWPGRGGK